MSARPWVAGDAGDAAYAGVSGDAPARNVLFVLYVLPLVMVIVGLYVAGFLPRVGMTASAVGGGATGALARGPAPGRRSSHGTRPSGWDATRAADPAARLRAPQG